MVIPPILSGETDDRMSLNHDGFGIIRWQMKLRETSDGETPDRSDLTAAKAVDTLTARQRLLIVALIFLIALGVRLLNWHSAGNDAFVVQSSVALNYKHLAQLLRTNGLRSLYDASSATSNPDLLGHPPGYPILLSLVYRAATNSDTAIQLLQLALDSVSVVIIVLIAFELFPAAIGIISGLLCALAPQFSWNSFTLLPDSLAALPILLALLLIARNRQQHNRSGRSGLFLIFTAGALVGVSCWLRANALLLAPFLSLVFLITRKREARWRPALGLIGGALLIISPLTIRNAVVFGKFIPVSLGAGQTLIEGIADYNTDGSLGLPQTDVELTRAEAGTFHRPDYANSLFTPDGVERDRARMTRAVAVIRAHPFWFAGVMVRRAASMLRLERTPLRLTLTSTGWQRLLHWPLLLVQRLFITAIFLPLTLLGAYLLGYRRQFQTLGLLLVVPFYYFCVQSALHTEYRYVLVIHYFLFVLAAVGLYALACKVAAAWKAAR
jgi:4-amino-4-deoxy-L-arabinose transferase-like glycosyltransferase